MIVKKVGKITLAITLIGAGLLLLAEKFLTIPFRDLFKYWPVLIIALGVEMIVSVFIYGRKKDVQLKYDKTALLAAIIFSVVASGVSNTFGFTELGPQMMFDGMKYQHQQTETLTKDNISKNAQVVQIIVDSSFGDIDLVPSPGKEIKAKLDATLHFNEKNAVTGGLDKLISITEGNITTIKINAPEAFAQNAFSRSNLKLTVYVPSGISVQASNSFGEINGSGLTGKIVLVNKHGSLTAENISGSLTAENSFGSIDISKIAGDANIINRNGSVSASDIKGNLDSDNNFGSTEIEDVVGNATVKSGNGSIKISDVGANATVRNNFGRINVSGVSGNADITNSNGSIELAEAKGNIKIKSSFGSVVCGSTRLEDAKVQLSTSFGKIQPVNGVSATESTSSSKLDKTFGAGSFSIIIENANGDIILK